MINRDPVERHRLSELKKDLGKTEDQPEFVPTFSPALDNTFWRSQPVVGEMENFLQIESVDSAEPKEPHVFSPSPNRMLQCVAGSGKPPNGVTRR
jgi:hypothetical protein